MKWIGLIISLIIAAMALKYFVYDTYHPKADNPPGMAGVFVEAARKGDDARIGEMCEPLSRAETLQVAHQLATLSFNTPLVWQAMKPEKGEGAIVAQLTGAGKMLVIEWNRHNKSYRICRATIADF